MARSMSTRTITEDDFTGGYNRSQHHIVVESNEDTDGDSSSSGIDRTMTTAVVSALEKVMVHDEEDTGNTGNTGS